MMSSKVISMVCHLFMFALMELLLMSDNRCLASMGVKCGQRKLSYLPSTTAENAVTEGGWPWFAAIFVKSLDRDTYICGGSVISENFILTAAHCTSHHRSLLSPDDFFVKLGPPHKIGSSDGHTKICNIVEVIRHVDFNTGKLGNDVALLRTEKDITFSDYIQPICLWPQEQSESTEALSDSGYILRWARGDNNKPMDVLHKVELPFIDQETCLKNMPMDIRKLFSVSKSNFCAENRDRISICEDSRGSGMYVRLDDAWYIRGLISTEARSEHNNNCNSQQFVVFTDISNYLKWIYNQQRHVKSRNLLALDDCGVDKHKFTTNELDKPEFLQYPWMALLEFENLSKSVLTFCNGALIHPRFVITVGHCVESSLKNYKLRSVRLGEYNQKLNTDVGKHFNGTEVTTKAHSIDVEKIFKHREFNNPGYDNNIALLKLKSRANIDLPNVKPICIPTLEDHNEEYTVSGWKRVGRDSHVLARAAVVLEDSDTCRATYRKFNINTSENQVCGTFHEEERRCLHFMSGAPMQYVKRVDRGNRYFLKGLFSIGYPHCKQNFTDVFTSINYFTDWISKTVRHEI